MESPVVVRKHHKGFCFLEETMYHHFETGIAEAYGINAAVILENIRFWVMHNEANGTNFRDGRYWTYNSMKAFESLFPYMKPRAIRSALELLKEKGLIVTGNYNQSTYDRTKWYALTDRAYAMFPQVNPIWQKRQMDLAEMTDGFVGNGESICQKRQMDSAALPNGFVGNDRPIPDGKPDGKTLDKTSDGKPDEMHRLGEYDNVLLTDGDLTKLQSKFPDWEERIERLSSYMASTGKSYKNHCATIEDWARRDSANQKTVSTAKVGGRRRPTPEEIMEEHGVDYMTAQEMLFEGTY